MLGRLQQKFLVAMSKRTVEFVNIDFSVDIGGFHSRGDCCTCTVASCTVSLHLIEFPDSGGKESSALLAEQGHPVTIAAI